MWSAFTKVKIKKLVGPDGVQVETWKVLGSLGIGWVTKIVNKILVEEKNSRSVDEELYGINI